MKSALVISLIIVVIVVGLTGCGLIPTMDLIQGQASANLATEPPATRAVPPTLEPTTTFQFPATYTPYWIKAATPTPEDTATLWVIRTSSNKTTATPLYPNGLSTIVGSASQKTSTIPFKAGKITLVWKYSGGVQEVENLTVAAKTHKDRLATLYTNNSQTMAMLNGYLASATNSNDTVQISHWKDEIQRVQTQYSQDVDKESIRYQSEIGKITTPFSIKISRITVDKPTTLVSTKGVYIGQATFKTVSAPDYYFIIEASGPYQIDITR